MNVNGVRDRRIPERGAPTARANLSRRTRRDRRRRSGQSLLESCLAIGLICLIFMGLIQLSQTLAAYDVLHHAAARGSRCKTVGFNEWMVTKCVNVAAIPVSGRLETPEFENVDPQLREMVASLPPGELWDEVLREAEPTSEQVALELSRIPDYLYSDNHARASHILNYVGWDTLGRTVHMSGNTVQVRTRMDYDLTTLWGDTMHRAFYNDDSVPLHGESTIENHYPLYLVDLGL